MMNNSQEANARSNNDGSNAHQPVTDNSLVTSADNNMSESELGAAYRAISVVNAHLKLTLEAFFAPLDEVLQLANQADAKSVAIAQLYQARIMYRRWLQDSNDPQAAEFFDQIAQRVTERTNW